MQEIKPIFVTFEQAKLLKKKGFNEITGKFWSKVNQSDAEYVINEDYMTYYWNSVVGTLWSAPEQWQVIEWLLINHGIWIYVYPYSWNKKDKLRWCYCISIIQDKKYTSKSITSSEFLSKFSSPQEATSIAINYVLNNLI